MHDDVLAEMRRRCAWVLSMLEKFGDTHDVRKLVVESSAVDLFVLAAVNGVSFEDLENLASALADDMTKRFEVQS
jgi:hypothetical protein